MQEKMMNLISKYATSKEMEWITSRKKEQFSVAFVAASRFVRKEAIPVNELYENLGNAIEREIYWPLDRLVRIYFLQQLSADKIQQLLDTSEINEAVAIYTALPFLEQPEQWFLRATDAVRSNIGNIFDAIAFENPYPKLYFTELAWNQLVLKCIFNDKPIHLIEGLDERKNAALAQSISALAHERWAAGRYLPAQAWRLVLGFRNEAIDEDIARLEKSDREEDRLAASIVNNQTENGFQASDWKPLEIV